ncbi:MAG: PKD domain-containing protein, partial [Anaerolineae bacterium]|nr:PKD domain-containing protein [Anaerolineae bacterium]NIN96134.1 PKD domain-containing protein [Anaerolineae bacterium]
MVLATPLLASAQPRTWTVTRSPPGGPRTDAVMDTVTPTEPVVWWLTIENNGLSWVAIEISSDMVVIFSTKVGFGGDKTAIVDSPEVALLAGMTYDLMFYPGGKKGSWALLTEQMMIAMPPVAAFDFSPAEPQAGAPVTFDASASSDPDGTIVSYDWDFGDGSMGSGVVVEHTYAMAGDYSVTLTVTDSQGLHSTTSKVVTVIAPPVMRTLDVTFFDFFDTPFGDYWLSREIWGDSIFHNTYPYIHMYQHPFFTGNVYELYGGAKMRAVGQNLGELTIDAPLFFPLLGDTGIPGGLVDLSYRLTYPDPARLADLDCVYFRCRKTLGTSDDGWISEWRGNLTMDRTTAAKVLSLPEGQDVASWWMTNELPVEDAWFFYLDAEGNGRLDIFNAFEWPYDNFVV